MKKVIQVGLGGMGDTWLNTILASSQIEYSGFVEINENIARMQAEKYNLNPSVIFHSLDAAIASVSVDGIIDITPPQFHREISLMALESGIPVLSEKPLAGTLESAREIVQKANQTGVLHMVAQNYRYQEPVQTLKQVLDSGQLGSVSSVSVEFFKGPHFGGFREEMPYPLIIDMAIHHFDLMRFLLNSEPVSIFGRSWNPPWSWYKGDASASVSIDFSNDVFVTYNGSWCSNGKQTSWNGDWRFECEQGNLCLQDDKVFIQILDQEVVPIKIISMPRVTQTYLLDEFYQALTHGINPATTCQDNIKSLAMVFGAVASFKDKKPVYLINYEEI